MRWALRFCILGHRSMDVPKKHSLEAMFALLDVFLREGAGRYMKFFGTALHLPLVHRFHLVSSTQEQCKQS